MSEKMREDFESWINAAYGHDCSRRDDDGNYADIATCSQWTAWQAAVITHKNGRPESEVQAGIRWCIGNNIYWRPTATDALEYANSRLAEGEEFDCCKSDTRVKEMNNVRTLFIPSASAIETAALRKAAEICNQRAWLDTTSMQRAEAKCCGQLILNLIPQDSITALEEFGMKVAKDVRLECLDRTQAQMYELPDDGYLRSIVASLIGEKK